MTFEWEAGGRGNRLNNRHGAGCAVAVGCGPREMPTEVKRAIKSWQDRSKVRFSGEGLGFGDGEPHPTDGFSTF
jgi:hypothetical protein